MDVTWSLLSDTTKSNILDQCREQSWDGLDEWMLCHYGAARTLKNTQFVYTFSSKEKYVEFCLKWM